MAFPVVTATTSGNEAVDDTSYTITGITGAIAGERLVTMIAMDGTPTLSGFPAGWVQRKRRLYAPSTDGTVEAWEKLVADGTETDFAITLSATEMKAHVTYRISGHESATAMAVSTGATGNSTTPDPDTLTPAWGSADTLWIAIQGHDADASTSGFPANYTLYNASNQAADFAGGTGIGVAARTLAAASDDPGTFTISGGQEWGAFTIGIPPLPSVAVVSGGPYSPAAGQSASIAKSVFQQLTGRP